MNYETLLSLLLILDRLDTLLIVRCVSIPGQSCFYGFSYITVFDQYMLQEITNNGFKWINVVRPTKEHMNALEEEFHFHKLNLEDSLSKIHISKIDRYEDHIFIILHFLTIGQDKLPRSGQLAAFIGHDYLVTVHRGELKSLVELFEQRSQSDKSRQECVGKSAAYLFHTIIDIPTDDLSILSERLWET
jgi:magnesium transporter